MDEKRNAWTVWQSVLICLPFAVSTISICQEARRADKAQIFAEPYDSTVKSGEKLSVQAAASTADQSKSGLQLPGWPDRQSIRDFFDHTRNGCPPQLLVKATKVLGEHILNAWDGGMSPVPPKKRQYLLVTVSGKEGIFLEKDGDYVYVNSGAELLAINEIIGESTFTRQDFNNPERVDSFLSELAGLHQGPRRCPGSSVMLRMTKGESAWLWGTEKDEGILRNLCKNPQFAFEGDTWTVIFNMFKADGAVDRWKVIGEHDPKVNRNQILNIEVAPLKPPRTFSWPFMG